MVRLGGIDRGEVLTVVDKKNTAADATAGLIV